MENESDSPESQVFPYEDISTKQKKISGEAFPETILGICDSCHWCYSSINIKAIIATCPLCRERVSHVPMHLDEICLIDLDSAGGLRLTFGRSLPLR